MPIEQVSGALERIVSSDQEVEWLGSGYGGGAVSVGPRWWKQVGYLLFRANRNNQRLQWTPG